MAPEHTTCKHIRSQNNNRGLARDMFRHGEGEPLGGANETLVKQSIITTCVLGDVPAKKEKKKSKEAKTSSDQKWPTSSIE